MLIVDIGCGQKKLPGSIGIDCSPFSTADHVLDLNKDPLPFEGDTVDFVYSSHALEHLSWDGFMHILSEIYRIAKNNAQIFISVPYYQGFANLSNPFHNNQIAFNENTFRFFSSEAINSNLDDEDYKTPSCPQWGLRYSANEELGIEIRTLKIDYIYYEQYVEQDKESQRLARHKFNNVVDVINYHLQVVKPAPMLIEKKSQYTDDFHSLIEEQGEYYQDQINYLKTHPAVSSVQEKLNNIMEDVHNYRRTGEVYLDDNDVVYPSVEVHRIKHDVIQKIQRIIDGLQV